MVTRRAASRLENRVMVVAIYQLLLSRKVVLSLTFFFGSKKYCWRWGNNPHIWSHFQAKFKPIRTLKFSIGHVKWCTFSPEVVDTYAFLIGLPKMWKNLLIDLKRNFRSCCRRHLLIAYMLQHFCSTIQTLSMAFEQNGPYCNNIILSGYSLSPKNNHKDTLMSYFCSCEQIKELNYQVWILEFINSFKYI